MSESLLEFTTSLTYAVGDHGSLIGATVEGQEGADATVLLNGTAITYPVTLAASDTLTLTRADESELAVTRLYGQLGTLVLEEVYSTRLTGGFMDNMPLDAPEVGTTGLYATDFRVKALQPITFNRLQFERVSFPVGDTVSLAVFSVDADGNRAELAAATPFISDYSDVSVTFQTDIVLNAGDVISIGFYVPQGTTPWLGCYDQNSSPAHTDDGRIENVGIAYYDMMGETFLNTTFIEYRWVDMADAPLPAAQFPVGDIELTGPGGFMQVNDVTKTASLVWKFSDGSTKKVDLT